MAIKKKGNTGFLNGTTVERFDNIVPAQPQNNAEGQAEELSTVKNEEGRGEAPAPPAAAPQATPELIRQVAEMLQKGAVQGFAPFDFNTGQKMGRPRQELIKGVHEVSVNLQLPENLVEALRAKAKAEKRSMKELIGRAVMDAYPECWATK